MLNRRLIDVEETERFEVVDPHRVRIGLEQKPILGFPFANGIFRSFALGDVASNGRKRPIPARGIRNGKRRTKDVDDVACLHVSQLHFAFPQSVFAGRANDGVVEKLLPLQRYVIGEYHLTQIVEFANADHPPTTRIHKRNLTVYIRKCDEILTVLNETQKRLLVGRIVKLSRMRIGNMDDDFCGIRCN